MKTNQFIQQCNGLIFALLACCASGAAHASTVVYADVDFFYGTVKVENSEQFLIKTAGLYQATLTDFKFPNAFSGEFGMTISATTAGDDRLVGVVVGPGSFTFQATPNTFYWANVYGFAGKPLDLGLYGVKVVQVSAVPVPGAAMLLMSGLVALVGFGRGGAQLLGTPRTAEQAEQEVTNLAFA